MDQNNVHPQEISINTKLLNSLQPQWIKYVTMTCQKYILKDVIFDQLYDHLSQFEPHVNASKEKKAARNHDPLALVANSHSHSSNSHAKSSYTHSPQPYYVTHPSSVIDYEDDYQRDIQGDAYEDKLTTATMLLARGIDQRYSTPTNNRLCTSSNTRNQAVIQDGQVDIQSKNVGYAGNGNRNVGRQNEATNVRNGHYARDCPKPKVRDAKFFKEKDFLFDYAYRDNTLEERNVVVIMMAHIQPTDDKSDTKPTYDVEFINDINASQIDMINRILSKSDHEQRYHEKL
ncbi:hypothetical protein Tco_0070009 [Tanacetum coccineum]